LNPSATFALSFLAAMPALAGNDISWVANAPLGNDANACTLAAPCRTFQAALSSTNSYGTITALDAADYGVTTILTQAVTIDGNGVGATILATSPTGAAIYVSEGAGPVIIRNLTIHVPLNRGSGIITGANTEIENVAITGGPNNGVVASAFASIITLAVKNLSVAAAANYGIFASGVKGTVRDSVVRAATFGVYVSNSSGPATLLIERCDLTGNIDGLYADGSAGAAAAVARLSDSVITANFVGLVPVNGGQIISFRNNMLAGNGTDGSTPFSASLK
jgi:hypothetical protein